MELQSGLIMLDGLQRGIVEDSRDGGSVSGSWQQVWPSLAQLMKAVVFVGDWQGF